MAIKVINWVITEARSSLPEDVHHTPKLLFVC